jgi:hypothetical protein
MKIYLDQFIRLLNALVVNTTQASELGQLLQATTGNDVIANCDGRN